MADEFTATDENAGVTAAGVELEPTPEGVAEAEAALWAGVVDFADDRKLSEPTRDRLIRAGRTLAQGLAGAVVVGAGPVLWDALRGDPTNVTGAVTAFGTAALGAVAAYFHVKRK